MLIFSNRLSLRHRLFEPSRQVLPHEQVYLDALPSAAMYEKSYMHRDVITHVARSRPALLSLIWPSHVCLCTNAFAQPVFCLSELLCTT